MDSEEKLPPMALFLESIVPIGGRECTYLSRTCKSSLSVMGVAQITIQQFVLHRRVVALTARFR